MPNIYDSQINRPAIEPKKFSKILYSILFLGLIVVLIIYFSKPSQGQAETVADIYCATFQARNESGLGKPLDVLHPRIMTMDDASSRGQQFQQIIVVKMMPLMKKYKWDSGKLGEGAKKADELMKEKSFREKVFNLLRKRDECHPEYLD